MKIKEAAQCTGLTEKAIRFYEQKHLITPQTYELNGRTFREYSEENIRDLRHIAVLRRSFFTVEQIRTILAERERTPEVFRQYRQTLCADYAQMTPLVQRIQNVGEDELQSLADVAVLLSEPETEEVRPMPRELRLSPVDESTPGERTEAYRTFLRHQSMRDRRDAVLSLSGKILRFCGILLATLVAMYTLWFALDNFRILRKVNVTLQAVEWQEGKPETGIPRTVTLSGEIRDYLFRTDFGDLAMEVSGYTRLHEDLGPTVITVTGNYGRKTFYCHMFDTAQREEDGEFVLFDRIWENNETGFWLIRVCENTGTGSYTYDPESEKSSLLAVGITDAAQAQTVFEYARIEDRRLYELRMEDLYGKRNDQ